MCFVKPLAVGIATTAAAVLLSLVAVAPSQVALDASGATVPVPAASAGPLDDSGWQ